MRKSFYTWLMTERNPKSNSPKAILANLAFEESAFPKHTDDFDQVSRFLEEHASFSFNMGDFDRIWGLLAYQEDFQRLARPAYNNMQNQNWPAIVYRLKLSGTFVYLPENNMLGFIHPSERYAEPRLGQVLDVRVIGFREVDRTLNLSLKPRSFEMLENDAQMILTYLESNGGFMTLNDKSSPDDIKATFGISKGQFKKALGGLMKAGKIKQDEFGTELI